MILFVLQLILIDFISTTPWKAIYFIWYCLWMEETGVVFSELDCYMIPMVAALVIDFSNTCSEAIVANTLG